MCVNWNELHYGVETMLPGVWLPLVINYTIACILVLKKKKRKKGDPWTWAVPSQFGPNKAQTWVSEPAA